MTFIALTAAFAILLLGGMGAALAVMSRVGRINLVECLCFAWLFGVGLISLLLWTCAAFCSNNTLIFAVTALAILSAFAGWRELRRHNARLFLPRPASVWQWLLLVALLFEIAAVFYGSAKHTLGWDGLLVWEIKARYAFLNDGVMPASYFAGSDRLFSHPDYPLALPLTQLWIYLWIGEPNQFWAKAIYPVFYAVGAVLLALFGTRVTGQRTAGLLLALLLFFVPQVSVSTGGTLVGYADFPLAVYYLAAIGSLVCAFRRESNGSFALYAVTLALLPWIKKEGAILWLVAALGGVALILAQRRSRRAWLALLPGLLVIAGWNLFLNLSAAARSADFGAVTLSTLREHANRLPHIVGEFATEMGSAGDWGIFWAALAVAIVAVIWRSRRMTSALLLCAIVLPLGLCAASYIFSAWPHYMDHVSSSCSRLLMQVVPVGWLLIGVAVRATVAPPVPERPAESAESLAAAA